MEPEMIRWIYKCTLLSKFQAKDLVVNIATVGDPFHGRSTPLQKYIDSIKNVKDGW